MKPNTSKKRKIEKLDIVDKHFEDYIDKYHELSIIPEDHEHNQKHHDSLAEDYRYNRIIEDKLNELIEHSHHCLSREEVENIIAERK